MLKEKLNLSSIFAYCKESCSSQFLSKQQRPGTNTDFIIIVKYIQNQINYSDTSDYW